MLRRLRRVVAAGVALAVFSAYSTARAGDTWRVVRRCADGSYSVNKSPGYDEDSWVKVGPGLTVRSSPSSVTSEVIGVRRFKGGLLMTWTDELGDGTLVHVPYTMDVAYVPSLEKMGSINAFRRAAPDGAVILVTDISRYGKAVQLIQAAHPLQIIAINSDSAGAKRLLSRYPKVIHGKDNESTCWVAEELGKPPPHIAPIVIPGPITIPCVPPEPPEAGTPARSAPSASAPPKSPPPIPSASAAKVRHARASVKKSRSKCGCAAPGRRSAPGPRWFVTGLLVAVGALRRRQRIRTRARRNSV